MIVTKSINEVLGYIEYSYEYKKEPFEEDPNDPGTQYESDTFSTLHEFLQKVSPSVIEEIREQLSVERVWVSNITLRAKSEESGISANLSMFDKGKSRAIMSATINNEDVESRLLINLQKMKEIVDNTLQDYPVKY